MLGIIGAMEVETFKICEMIEQPHTSVYSGIKYVSGTIFGKDVVVAQCFEGKVNSAVAAQTMILIYKPQLIINTGVAGGLLPDMDICDIAVATAVVQHDFDLTPVGCTKGFIPNINKDFIPCSTACTDSLFRYASELPDTKVFKGIVASGDQFINSNEKQKQLYADFNAVCTEMEGASIGHVCCLNNVDFCVLRAISDKADDNSDFDFREFVEGACEKTVTILTRFIREM